MEFPLISSEAVFLNLFQVGSIVPSERKESVSKSPEAHGEVAFRSRHILKLCEFSIRHYCSKMRQKL